MSKSFEERLNYLFNHSDTDCEVIPSHDTTGRAQEIYEFLQKLGLNPCLFFGSEDGSFDVMYQDFKNDWRIDIHVFAGGYTQVVYNSKSISERLDL